MNAPRCKGKTTKPQKRQRNFLQDCVNQIERLAQIVYSRTDDKEYQSLADKALFRTVNNGCLQRYYLAAKVDSIKVAVEMEKAYYQVKGPQGVNFTVSKKKRDERQSRLPHQPAKSQLPPRHHNPPHNSPI